jgi:signal transduction histidine kinase
MSIIEHSVAPSGFPAREERGLSPSDQRHRLQLSSGSSCCARCGAIAVENAQLRQELRARQNELDASRARIVKAGDKERRRLERNLHDGAQQRLVALAMQLRLIRADIRRDPASAEAQVTTAAGELALSLEELRELARGIHPAVLQYGLPSALESLAIRSPVPTALRCDLQQRLPEQIELAAYFVTCEALANVAKYAGAATATVNVARSQGHVVVEVADDGVGGADPLAGSGLRGLADRVEALGGGLSVSSPVGKGTKIVAEMPLVPVACADAARIARVDAGLCVEDGRRDSVDDRATTGIVQLARGNCRDEAVVRRLFELAGEV